MMKRAARNSFLWKEALLYEQAHDEDGKPVKQNGMFAWDFAESTFGYRDLAREREIFTGLGAYEGKALVTVIAEVTPAERRYIKLGGVFFQVSEIHNADTAGCTIRYLCLIDGNNLEIRNDQPWP
ncbi:hypothetical protein [Albibacillus kandeliae]|uniref:hypothetical protein n=1 Tax=Albibacillus kandeliae TaxID=2174228 RepID=UPI000D69AA69|nr:hypothetical protein [Albibacillus kandeliae]